MSDSWHSYPSIFAIGHRALKEMFLDPVIIEEKIDGSQFSFGRFIDDHMLTLLKCKSKGQELNIDAPEKMFNKAVDIVRSLDLRIGWTYRAEYLQKPKHNTLAYDRIPEKHLIVFDINTGHEKYLSYADKKAECDRLGLECVPLIYEGMVVDSSGFMAMLDRVSILGGQNIEGVVVKNYARFGPDKKVLLGKFVSEHFKEIHGGEWRAANPTHSDIIDSLIHSLRTPARWQKAVQHLRESGNLDVSPRDIGNLIKETQQDVEKECTELITEQLVKWALPKILRGVVHGLPEWYKEELVKQQFTKD